jgi:hypothetical protein
MALMILSLASLELLRHNTTLTVPLTHHCKLVILKATAFHSSLSALFVTWSMFATGALRTCLMIVGCWDHLVDVQKLLEATRTICVTATHLPHSPQCKVHSFSSVVFAFCLFTYVYYPTEWARKWIIYKRLNSVNVQNTYSLTEFSQQYTAHTLVAPVTWLGTR